MAVLSAQDVERFTPERYLVNGEVPAGAPVFLVGGMTWKERARWRAQVAGEGVRFPQDGEIINAARLAIADLEPSNAAELLAVVQAYDDMPVQPLPKGDEESSDEAAARQAETESRRLIVQAYEALIDKLRQHPTVGTLLSLRTLYFELVPPMAAAFCLRGWENVSVKYERVNGVVPDRVLDFIADDLMAIGNKALAMQQVSAPQKGNSPSPSP